MKKWAIALHGGAGVVSPDIPEDQKKKYVDSLNAALKIGEEILQKGGLAIHAAEQVVRYLEDNELFNAGKGSVFASDGGHELEASIMKSNLECGAVCGIKTVKNPISLARRVMENTKHVYLYGEGAEKFAVEQQVEQVPNSYFDTEHRRTQWLARKAEALKSAEKKGTVGCVCLDMEGNLCAATSTGGLTNKRVGRVADTSVIGAGTYCNHLVAISCTGTGEEFIRHAVAHDVAAILEYKKVSLKEATEEVVFKKLQPDDGGLISVDKDGNISCPFNSDGMFRACADWNGKREVAIWKDLEKTDS